MVEKGIKTKQCKNCGEDFLILEKDLEFYKKSQIPHPSHCPYCRAQRRLAFRNEKNLYKRKCDFTEKRIISIYSPDKPYKVYSSEIWWSDKWDPLDYGMDFDFSLPFFNQFKSLLEKVPRLGIINRNSQNSDYTNICEQNKNCYLLVESSNNEGCLYGYWMQKSRDCVECSYCHECTECYECDNCENCYNLQYSQNCKNCSDSFFLKNCIGCRKCFGCIDLARQQYHIFNKAYSEKDYEKEIKKLEKDYTHEKFQKFCLKFPHKYAEIIQSQNCTGNYISNSRDCHYCFHTQDAEHCKYSVHVWRNSKFAFDCDTVGMDSELAYECINTAINSYNNKFCNRCWTVADSYYCNECDNSKNLFGCIGLNHKQYCILNKQYSKQEYEKLLSKIIEHMKQAKEYGEFFPIKLSPFAYNETAAHEFYPLTKQQALKKGYKWKE